MPEQLSSHTMFAIHDRDLRTGDLSVRLHGKGPQGAKLKEVAITDILDGIEERWA